MFPEKCCICNSKPLKKPNTNFSPAILCYLKHCKKTLHEPVEKTQIWLLIDLNQSKNDNTKTIIIEFDLMKFDSSISRIS